MAYHGPRVKLSRRLGIPLTTKAAKVMVTKPYGPGQHGQRRSARLTDFGTQLLEKQKLKAQYNVNEKQLRRYYQEAKRLKGNTGENLVRLLEQRLDAVVLRSGIAPTIFAARQLVSHGHILVNGQKVNVPSQQVEVGHVVSLREKSRNMQVIIDSLSIAATQPYLEVDRSLFTAKLVKEPSRDEVPVLCEIARVIEFCAR